MMGILFVILAVVLIVGSALILLRNAKFSKVPDTVKPKPYEEDEADHW
jgi:uncharacterized protein YxeA